MTNHSRALLTESAPNNRLAAHCRQRPLVPRSRPPAAAEAQRSASKARENPKRLQEIRCILCSSRHVF